MASKPGPIGHQCYAEDCIMHSEYLSYVSSALCYLTLPISAVSPLSLSLLLSELPYSFSAHSHIETIVYFIFSSWTVFLLIFCCCCWGVCVCVGGRVTSQISSIALNLNSLGKLALTQISKCPWLLLLIVLSSFLSFNLLKFIYNFIYFIYNYLHNY